MNDIIKKSLKVSLVDAIVVSIFAAFIIIIRFPEEYIIVSGFSFFPLFLLFFISSLFITKSSKKEPVSIFLYPFLKTDFATLKIPFILSLIACIILFGLLLYYLVSMLFFGLNTTLRTIIFSISFLIIMRIGLIFMARLETSTKGGIIVLIIGLVSMWAFIMMVRWDTPFFLLCMLLSILAIIGGSLGIKRGEKYYANEILKIKSETGKIRYSSAPFIIPIISFIFAVVPVLILVFAFVKHPGRGVGEQVLKVFLLMFLPLAAISTTLNIIGMFKIWRETNPNKELIEIILMIITWCLVVFSVGSGLFLLMGMSF